MNVPRTPRAEQQAYQFALGYKLGELMHGHSPAVDLEDCKDFARWFGWLSNIVPEKTTPADAFPVYLTRQHHAYAQTLIESVYPLGLPCKECRRPGGQHKMSCSQVSKAS